MSFKIELEIRVNEEQLSRILGRVFPPPLGRLMRSPQERVSPQVDEEDEEERTHCRKIPPQVELISPEVRAAVAEAIAKEPPPQSGKVAKVDTAGNIWDARVHSASGTVVKDGTFKLKRNVDKDWVTKVLGGPQVAPVPAPELAPPPPSPVPPPPNATTATPAVLEVSPTFVELIQRCKGLGLNFNQMHDLAEKYGLAAMAMAAADPDKIPEILNDEIFK